jgi:DNA polymerase-3 subunit delta'
MSENNGSFGFKKKILNQNCLKNSASSTGNFNKALQLLQPDSEFFFEKWFVDWVRAL